MRFTINRIPLYCLPMKTHLKCLTILIAAVVLAGCFRNDIRTVTFSIDRLRTPDEAMQLAQALRRVDGIKEIRPNLDEHTLTVVFNGRVVYIKNIEHEIAAAGFSLPNRPASETADSEE